MLEQQWQTGTSVHEGNAGLAMIEFNALDGREDYLFDDEAKGRSRIEIKEQLLPRIEKHPKTTAGQLYENIANETPAKRKIVYTAIEDMAKDGQVRLLTTKGRRTQKVNDTTAIDLPKQRTLFLLD